MMIREFVEKRKAELKREVSQLGKPIVLSIVQVGHNPASDTYIRGKMRDSKELGIESRLISLSDTDSEGALLAAIEKENDDHEVTGLIVQLPLPAHMSVEKVNATISPRKDVDGFVPNSRFVPCTPLGIIRYLESEQFEFNGKNAVVLGRSDIVGKPMARELLKKNMNVTVLHSRTRDEDRRFYLAHADLVVVAIGKMAYLDESYELKPTAIIIDVGINRDEDGKLHGDAKPNLRVRFQSPVPGGVGLLTRLALMENVLEGAKWNS